MIMDIDNNENENENEDGFIPDVKTVAILVRRLCVEARNLEVDFSNDTLLDSVSCYDIEDAIDLCYTKSKIMGTWGHDHFSELFWKKGERYAELYFGMFDACEVYVN